MARRPGTKMGIAVAGVCLGLLMVFLSTPGVEGQKAEKSSESAVVVEDPLAGLPSTPGLHLAKLKAMGDDTWLNLGSPAPDPTWGSAKGRSYTPKMAFAPDLQVGFLFGEGVHGFWDKASGRYMDDFWAYDINAHRWICIYPGADVNGVNRKLDEHGFEITQDGEHMPVAQMVHGYEQTSYDIHLKKFIFVSCPGAYWRKGLGKRRSQWLTDKARIGHIGYPWFYDVATGRWGRRYVEGEIPAVGFGAVLVYVPTKKQTFLRFRGGAVWFYDYAANRWTDASPEGPPPPFGIEPVAYYDSKRDRIYLGGGGYPPVNALWIYDVKTNRWIDPHPKGQPGKGAPNYSTTRANMTYDSANDVVLLNLHWVPEGKGKAGLYVYSPESNTWTTEPKGFPEGLNTRASFNAFYDPELNLHFYHVAGDSRPGGVIWAYRYKRVNK